MDTDPAFESDRYLLAQLRTGQCYEPEVAQVITRVLRPGDTAIDVGACIGFFTLMMAKMVGDGKVIAVEPAEDNLKKLRANLDLNELDNVEVVSQPLASLQKTTQFYLNSDSSGGHSLWPCERWPENVQTKTKPIQETVITRTLDDLGLTPRLIKIDVEGAEEEVLRGAPVLLNGFPPPFIVAELNWFGMQQMGSSEQSLRGLMLGHGYHTFLISPGGELPLLVPPKTLIAPRYITNILFSTIDAVSEVWTKVHD